MQKKTLIANWKSHKTVHEAEEWLRICTEGLTERPLRPSIFVMVAPSFPFLQLTLGSLSAIEQVAVSAQDVSQFPLGAYTGAVAAHQLASLKLTHCIVGHSERRRYFGETHQLVAQKIELLLDQGITPVVCVDEDEVSEQANLLSADQKQRIMVAYEPISAIGTGQGQDLAQVRLVVSAIKSEFGEIPVLYGGSVDERNIAEYVLASDGVLVGNSSLDAHVFLKLINAIQPSEE